MRAFALFYNAALFLTCTAALATSILYSYPALFGCNFPAPTQARGLFNINGRRNRTTGEIAPFRLLVLADPQLEGDTSLPDPSEHALPSLQTLWSSDAFQEEVISTRITSSLRNFLTKDIPLLFSSYRKRLDLLGNDYYLAHIYRSLYWWLEPTHVTVLGDLIGSQWITDEEFESRGKRFWHRVFKHGRRVEDDITGTPGIEELGQDPAWRRRLINIAGNHDVGYAGDMNHDRMTRYERVYGKANWIRTFQLLSNRSDEHKPPSSLLESTSETSLSASGPLSAVPELRLVILNSMALDGPALDPALQNDIYTFINNDVILPARPPSIDPHDSTFTILLTHIPLHKQAGVCVDAPFFDYYLDAGIREQNHLSPSSSAAILQGIFGMSGNIDTIANGIGRPGLILNGHDHEGCDVYHYVDRSDATAADHSGSSAEWRAARQSTSSHLLRDATLPGIREITGRSMMGSYGGYAGMLSVWFDEADGRWQYDYDTCHLGVQHIWWFVHVLLVVTILCWVCAAIAILRDTRLSPQTHSRYIKHTFQPALNGAVNGREKLE